MSQRESGYERVERDLYETPGWATKALVPHLPREVASILEPAAGGGKMSSALRECGMSVTESDISTGTDFLTIESSDADAIITNPPYEKAAEFVDKALALMAPKRGLVAMLLRTDFDHAKTRARQFKDCAAFAKKVVLTKRIVWFDRPGAAPSFNHAWYIWDWRNDGAPTIAYDLQ